MANGRITNEVIYSMFVSLQKDVGDVKGEVGRVAGKVEAICQDMIGTKKTVEDHTRQIGNLTGNSRAGTRWGTIVVTALTTGFFALAIYLITHGGAP
jgi:hypothetical protein